MSSTKAGGVYLGIYADDTGLKKGLKGAEKATKQSAKNMADSFDKAGSSIGKLKTVLGSMVGVLVAGKLSQGLQKSIKAASDLQEVTSKFNTVFGKQQKLAEGWAKTLVDGYAMSTRESKQ